MIFHALEKSGKLRPKMPCPKANHTTAEVELLSSKLIILDLSEKRQQVLGQFAIYFIEILKNAFIHVRAMSNGTNLPFRPLMA